MGFIIHTKTGNTNPGTNIIVFPIAFASRKVIQVLREGIGYDIIRGTVATPTGRQVWVRASGRVYQFAIDFNPGETVTIKWI